MHNDFGAWAMIVCLIVILTNRYPTVSIDGNLVDLVAPDGRDYLAIANSAPGLPTLLIPSHRAQRLFLPYLVGLVHAGLGVDARWLFQVSVFILVGCIFWQVTRLLAELSIGKHVGKVAITLLAFNPWATRLYLAFPELVPDLGFVLGLVVVIRGVVSQSTNKVLFGQLLASLSRQTAILIVPMTAMYVFSKGSSWSVSAKHRRFVAVIGSGCVAILVLGVTARISLPFSFPSRIWHIAVEPRWLSPDVLFSSLTVAFVGSLSFSPLPALGLLAGQSRISRRMSPFVTATALICIQPLLSGPYTVQGNGTRLVTLALVPLVVSVAFTLCDREVFQEKSEGWRFWIVIGSIATTSTHHIYAATWLPFSGSRTRFGVAYALASLTIAAVMYHLSVLHRSSKPLTRSR